MLKSVNRVLWKGSLSEQKNKCRLWWYEMKHFISYTISILFSNINIISVKNINIPIISNTKAKLSKSHLFNKRDNCFQGMMPDGNRQATLVTVSVSHVVYHVDTEIEMFCLSISMSLARCLLFWLTDDLTAVCLTCQGVALHSTLQNSK